jgi:hypothetical protein
MGAIGVAVICEGAIAEAVICTEAVAIAVINKGTITFLSFISTTKGGPSDPCAG